jgi:hypothetical protein
MPSHIKLIGTLLISLMMLHVKPALSDLVIIINADRPVDALKHEEVVNIFMGRYRKLADGKTVLPLDIKDEAELRSDFYRLLLDKNLAEINAYWARLIFSGRITPPTLLNTQQDVINNISENIDSIGYIDRKNLNQKVKAVYSFQE